MNRRASLIWRGTAASILVLGTVLAAWHWQRSRPHLLLLSDGTKVYFRGDSRAEAAPGYPHPRALRVNGDLFIVAPPGGEPLHVRSRLLDLTLSGDAAARITAYANESGEEAEVLRGTAVAAKGYASTTQGPDTVTAGQMVMVNQTIDLMEKEACSPSERQDLLAWSAKLTAQVSPP